MYVLAKFSNKWPIVATCLSLILIAILNGSLARAESPQGRYEQFLREGVARCEAIPAKKGQTFMFFNPRDRRMVYYRSSCFQELALQLRENSLCERVIERKSLFFNGSAVSPKSCSTAVEERTVEDRKKAAAIDPTQIIRISEVSVNRNGNGRDYDIETSFKGSVAGAYRFSVLAKTKGGDSTKIFETTYSYSTNSLQRSFFLKKEKIDQLPNEFAKHNRLKLEFEFALSPKLSDWPVFKYFPPEQLISRKTIEVDLSG